MISELEYAGQNLAQAWVEIVLPSMLNVSRLAVVTYGYDMSGGSVISEVFLDGSFPAASVLGSTVLPGGAWRAVVVALPAAVLNSPSSALFGVAVVVACDDGLRGVTDFVSLGSNTAGYPTSAVDGPAAGAFATCACCCGVSSM